MLYLPQHATGERLKEIREDAGLSIPEAVRACNYESKQHSSKVRFTRKQIRRFEEIGVNDRYGTTPPSYEELHLMMRVYNGSFGYLIWGIPPKRYPLEQYEHLVAKYLDPEILDHLDWLANLSSAKRSKIINLMKEVLSSKDSE